MLHDACQPPATFRFCAGCRLQHCVAQRLSRALGPINSLALINVNGRLYVPTTASAKITAVRYDSTLLRTLC